MKQSCYSCTLIFLLAAGIIICFAFPAHAKIEYDLYGKAESFTWKEFDNGDQVVKETGPIFGLGGAARWAINQLIMNINGEVFGGSVDYDGQTTGTNTPIPVDTDTDYLGFKIEGTIGWEIPISENSSIEPFIGPGIRAWNREIQGTRIGNIRVVDTEEDWLTVYAPLGIRGRHVFSDHVSIFAKGGIKIPIYNENEADLSEIYGVTVTVEPGREISGFAELGIRWKMLKAAIYYEGMRFSKSDPERKNISGGTLTVLQPKSEADMFGINIGVTF